MIFIEPRAEKARCILLKNISIFTNDMIYGVCCMLLFVPCLQPFSVFYGMVRVLYPFSHRFTSMVATVTGYPVWSQNCRVVDDRSTMME